MKFTKYEVEELLQRLFGKTSDEAPGHAFHGNQWTGGLGSKPEVPKEGGIKAKLAHLLGQGHSFTLKELSELLGVSEVTLRGRLSEIKKATAGGQLYLAKQGNNYFMAQKPIEAPIEPVDYAAEAKKEQEAGWAAEAAAAAKKAELEKQWKLEEVKTLVEKVVPEPGVFAPPASGKMDKAAADAIYAKSQKDWYDLIASQEWPQDTSKESIKALAEGFKKNKANGMAQWSANMTGEKVKAKDLGVFQADQQFVKDVILDHKSLADAMSAWKLNTQNEKAGTWPPDPFAEVKKLEAAKAAAEKAKIDAELYKTAQAHAAAEKAAKEAAELAALGDALKEWEPKYAPVTQYVAPTHVGIGLEDFVGSDPDFQKGILQLKTKLRHGHSDDVQNKIDVQKGIEARLEDSKAFAALKVQSKNKNKYSSLVATLISAWAGSSGDHQAMSVCNQIAVRDAFGMKDYSLGGMDLIKKSQASEDDVYSQAASSLDCRYNTPAEKATFRAGIRDFVLAQYHNTQDHLASIGVSELYIARGMGGDAGVVKDGSAATHGKLHLQPASSFTTNFSTTHGFAKGDSIYMVRVPASQVLGSYVTGFGCTNEHEVVVLAHPDTQAARIPLHIKGYNNANLEEAVHHVANTMKNAPPPSEHMLAVMAEKKAKQAAAEHKQALINAKAGGPAPTVPKYSKYSMKSYTKPAYAAAKKGDVEEVKKILAGYQGKFGMGGSGTYTKTYMAEIVSHAENVAAHKEAVKKAKAEIKAETKATKAPTTKQKKPVVHVHVHEPAKPPVTQHPAETHKQSQGFGAAGSLSEAKTVAATNSSHGKLWSEFLAGGGENWIKSHPMHNEAKYKQMVQAGKTPIQIKHYYGSLKHAAAKKQGATA